MASVPSTVARGTLRSGSRTLPGRHGSDLDAQVAEQGDRHAAADRADAPSPLTFHGVKLALLDVEQADGGHEREGHELEDRGHHLDRAHVLDAGQVDRWPGATGRSGPAHGDDLLWPLLMNTSTYSTQPTAIAALPAHAMIQYDHAVKSHALPAGLSMI